MMELQNKLGAMLEKLTVEGKAPGDRQKDFETAEYVAKIAKQMINNADVVLRTDKLCNTTDRIDRIVGK